MVLSEADRLALLELLAADVRSEKSRARALEVRGRDGDESRAREAPFSRERLTWLLGLYERLGGDPADLHRSRMVDEALRAAHLAARKGGS